MNIFIEIPTWLGDAVMTTPAIENIVIKYPDARLTIFGSFVSTRIFLKHPKVKQIVVDESKKESNRYLNLYNYAKKFQSFDLAISFRKNFTTKFLMFFLDSKEKYIYQRYNKNYTTHQVVRYNDFIKKSLKIEAEPSNLKIYMESNLLQKEKPLLGINPGATYGSAKRWYPQEFANIAIALSSKFDIIIFGGPNEVDIAQDIANLLDNATTINYTNLAGKTSVEELFQYISNLDIFITNDSGPMHVAAAFNIPTVAIFGPTRYKETHQWKNDNEILIRKDLQCSPCMKRVCPLKHHDCMKLITAEDVLQRLKLEKYI